MSDLQWRFNTKTGINSSLFFNLFDSFSNMIWIGGEQIEVLSQDNEPIPDIQGLIWNDHSSLFILSFHLFQYNLSSSFHPPFFPFSVFSPISLSLASSSSSPQLLSSVCQPKCMIGLMVRMRSFSCLLLLPSSTSPSN
jgi:hypothetical protein